MELRIWQFEKDDRYIDSYLASGNAAHNECQRTRDWFRWKFEQSPYGKAILACAFDGDVVAGNVTMGIGVATANGKLVKYALSYETYVNPKYQGKGLFKKLISVVDEECKKQGISFIYNFPNNKSLPGFIRLGYIPIENYTEYRINVKNWIKVIRHIMDLRKSFNPNPSNLDRIKNFHIPELKPLHTNSVIIPQWSKEYLEWRFQSYKNAEYWMYAQKGVFGIVRLGHRGCLLEAQVLYLQCTDGSKLTKSDVSCFEKELHRHVSPDFMSYCISQYSEIRTLIKNCTIKVPNRSNFTYKLFDSSINLDNEEFKIALNNIDSHTY